MNRIVPLHAFCLIAATLVCSLSLAESGCDRLNSVEFFKQAPTDDVERCLAAGADPNIRMDADAFVGTNITALHAAAVFSADSSVVELMLSAGADPASRSEEGETPVHLAGLNPTLGIVQVLLAAGADPNARTKWKVTPLHIAAIYANPTVIRTLLDAGADVNARMYDGFTPLHSANFSVEPNYVERAESAGFKPVAPDKAVELLLEAGAVVNAREENGRTPLHEAARYNYRGVELLLAGGADPNERDEEGKTPLHMAAPYYYEAARYNDNVAVTAALLAAGADPNARDENGGTPLHEAAENNPATTALLLRSGADANVRQLDGNTPLHEAAPFNDSTIFALLEAGADPRARNGADETALHFAARRNDNAAIIAILVERGGEPNATDKYQFRTPLHLAAAHNTLDVVLKLIEVGADIGARSQRDETPLHAAASRPADRLALLKDQAALISEGRIAADIVKQLVDAGADVDARDESGRTPLHQAAALSLFPAVITALLEVGADGKAQDDEGQTAYDIATDNKALNRSDAYWRLNDARF